MLGVELKEAGGSPKENFNNVVNVDLTSDNEADRSVQSLESQNVS